jgi:hypothetical protein
MDKFASTQKKTPCHTRCTSDFSPLFHCKCIVITTSAHQTQDTNKMKVASMVLLTLAVAACSALKIDPLMWNTPLNNTNDVMPTAQWVAVSPDGSSIIAMSGTNLVSLDPATGDVMWAAQGNFYLSSLMVFAVSRTTVLASVETGLIAFHLSNGSLIGIVDVPQGPNPLDPGITNIVVHDQLFVVYGAENIAVFSSDLVMLYSAVAWRINYAGVSTEYLYYTFSENVTSAFLVIVDLTTFTERRVDDVYCVSATATNGKILVVQFQSPLVATVELSSGAIVWRNTHVVFAKETEFVLLASTDLSLVVAGTAVHAFDPATGGLVFQYQSPYIMISFPIVADGRLVYVGSTSREYFQGRCYIAALDLSTGTSLGRVMTPTGKRASFAVSGRHAVMVNGQGYTHVNTITMTAESYNLNIPGASAVAIASATATSTTFVIVGLLGAAAVTLDA